MYKGNYITNAPNLVSILFHFLSRFLFLQFFLRLRWNILRNFIFLFFSLVALLFLLVLSCLSLRLFVFLVRAFVTFTWAFFFTRRGLLFLSLLRLLRLLGFILFACFAFAFPCLLLLCLQMHHVVGKSTGSRFKISLNYFLAKSIHVCVVVSIYSVSDMSCQNAFFELELESVSPLLSESESSSAASCSCFTTSSTSSVSVLSSRTKNWRKSCTQVAGVYQLA